MIRKHYPRPSKREVVQGLLKEEKTRARLAVGYAVPRSGRRQSSTGACKSNVSEAATIGGLKPDGDVADAGQFLAVVWSPDSRGLPSLTVAYPSDGGNGQAPLDVWQLR
jgi:hypothetical protein